MTGDIDIDGIMKAMTNPAAGKNIEGVMQAMKEVNKVLQEVQKTVDFLDRCGVKPLLVRAAGAKLGIDVDTPLQAENKGNGIDPNSATHAQVFHKLNIMSEKDVIDMFAGADNGSADKPTESDSSE